MPSDKRPPLTLACTECKRRNYVTTKNKSNTQDRLELKKYCRWCRSHTVHRETREFRSSNRERAPISGPFPFLRLPSLPMDLAQLAGQRFGPRPFRVSPQAVADFIEVTGDDSTRWAHAAPPGFMAAALFEVAPDLLALLYDHSVIHGEQWFAWNRPLPIGADLTVVGEVTRSRERGGVHFITFEIEVFDDAGMIATGSARFLAAGESAPTQAGEQLTEPEANDRGSPKAGQVSASRADLVRYAAATRDWNPVHWDHAAAVAAGLPGVVVHGLFQAAWALRTATEPTTGDVPLVSARVRFKSPLPPATPVDIDARWADTRVDVALVRDGAEYVTAAIELADE